MQKKKFYFLKRTAKNSINIILDVGANQGQSTRTPHKLFPNAEIHSFEPDPETFLKLRKNCQKIRRANCYQHGLGKKTKIIFPLHPRAKKNISKNLLKKYSRKIVFNPPFGHTRFIKTLLESDFVITDSGGVQEEAAVLGIPCGILRKNTERNEVLIKNHSFLISPKTICSFFRKSITKKRKPQRIKFWDGKTAQRIRRSLKNIKN